MFITHSKKDHGKKILLILQSQTQNEQTGYRDIEYQ